MEGAPLGKHNQFDMRKNEKQRRRGARFIGRWTDRQSNLQIAETPKECQTDLQTDEMTG